MRALCSYAFVWSAVAQLPCYLIWRPEQLFVSREALLKCLIPLNPRRDLIDLIAFDPNSNQRLL